MRRVVASQPRGDDRMLDMARVDSRGGDRHKGPKARAVRVEDELWDGVKARAQADGYETLNEAIVSLLEWYVARPRTEKRL
jgi:hypothetical protein